MVNDDELNEKANYVLNKTINEIDYFIDSFDFNPGAEDTKKVLSGTLAGLAFHRYVHDNGWGAGIRLIFGMIKIALTHKREVFWV